MIGIYLILVYGLGLLVLGLIILALAPALRLTFVNLIFFVTGAFLGLIISTNLYLYVSRALLAVVRVRSSSVADVSVYPVMSLGTTAGGAGLVWLKMPLRKEEVNVTDDRKSKNGARSR